MARSNRSKELKKLINAGYPLYTGGMFLLGAIYLPVKLAVGYFSGDGTRGVSGETIFGIVVAMLILGGIGLALIKVGLESKDEENRIP